MKNKKVTTLLIIVVVGIWGVIFFRLVSSMSGEDDYIGRSDIRVKINAKDFQEIKPYILIAKYRDPFLGRTFHEEGKGVISQRKNIPIVKKETIPAVEIDWSFIKYLGLINNSKINKKVGLISINNDEYMISDGDVIKEVKCIKTYKDSICISYQGKIKCLKR